MIAFVSIAFFHFLGPAKQGPKKADCCCPVTIFLSRSCFWSWFLISRVSFWFFLGLVIARCKLLRSKSPFFVVVALGKARNEGKLGMGSGSSN